MDDIRLEPEDRLYLMQRTVYNEDFPEPTEIADRVIEPYHDQFYLILIGGADEYSGFKESEPFGTIDEVINALKKISGLADVIIYLLKHYTAEVIIGKHPELPSKVNMESEYVEINGGITHYEDGVKLVESGIKISEGSDFIYVGRPDDE